MDITNDNLMSDVKRNKREEFKSGLRELFWFLVYRIIRLSPVFYIVYATSPDVKVDEILSLIYVVIFCCISVVAGRVKDALVNVKQDL